MRLAGRKRKKGGGLPFADGAGGERLAGGRGEAEQAQRVGDGGAALAHLSGNLVVGKAEIVRQLAVAFCGLEGIQVGPLQVFDESKLEAQAFVGAPNDHGGGFEADEAGGPGGGGARRGGG